MFSQLLNFELWFICPVMSNLHVTYVSPFNDKQSQHNFNSYKPHRIYHLWNFHSTDYGNENQNSKGINWPWRINNITFKLSMSAPLRLNGNCLINTYCTKLYVVTMPTTLIPRYLQVTVPI